MLKLRHAGAKRGFTLVELCIVIALLGIVSGLGVVSYGPLREQAADHTAERQLYNIRESFLHTKSMAEAGGQINDITFSLAVGEESEEELSRYIEKKMDSQLPELTGTYKVEAQSTSGVLAYTIRYYANDKVYTLNENGTVSIVQGTSLGNQATMDKIISIMKTTTRYLDSNAEEVSEIAHSTTTLALLRAAGLDPAGLNMTTWAYDNQNAMLLWTTLDIRDMELNTDLPIMRYNSKTGTYTVWITTVQENNHANGSTEYYNILSKGYSAYLPSTRDTPVAQQTYDNMLMHYANAMESLQFTK